MTEAHHVVIGNGPAGRQAAVTLRDMLPQSRISVVSRARQSCYSPHLLPDFIAGRIGEAETLICPLEDYERGDITLRCSQEVVELDIGKRRLTLAHREVVAFDGLIIAAGGKPRIPERLAAYSDQMHTLKTVEDAKVWIDRLERASTVLLMGGDLTSMAVAKALLQLGKRVSFILDETALWPLRADEELLNRVSRKLTEGGVEVVAGGDIEAIAFLPDGSCEVQTGGRAVRADMVGAFFGLVPDVAFLSRSGLRIDRGILVDEFLGTGFDGILATGDCAQIYHPELRDYWVSVGYENALELGRLAARNLACEEQKRAVKPQSVLDVRGINVNTSWWAEF